MTGSLRIKNGIYYAVINYKDNYGKYKQKWISTKLKERGNKKEAQRFLDEQIKTFNPIIYSEKLQEPVVKNNIIFIDYVKDYIEEKKKEVTPSVYLAYSSNYKVIKKFFGKSLKLKDVTYKHIEAFYEYLRNVRKVKNITVKHYSVVLSPALRKAYRDDLISKNPYEFLAPIKKEKSRMNYYNKEELEKLFEIADKTYLKAIVRIAAYYGLRRSELMGLRWQSIDFERKIIHIEHKAIAVRGVFDLSDNLKTQSSNRKLPLLPEIEELLKEKKENIEKQKMLYKKSYNTKYLDYIFVNEIGDLINPNTVSNHFRILLKNNNLKYIRFHDLRHSCASLLVAKGIPMKYVQEWLGHSNFNTTADVYSHLDFSTKVESANTISSALAKSEKQIEDSKEEFEEQEIEDKIKKLEKLLEEKRQRRKKEEAEM